MGCSKNKKRTNRDFILNFFAGATNAEISDV